MSLSSPRPLPNALTSPIRPFSQARGQQLGHRRRPAVVVADAVLVGAAVDDVEMAGDLDVLVVGDVGGAVGEDDDERLAGRGRAGGAEHVAEQLVGLRVDRPRPRQARGQQLGHRAPSGDPVRDPGRRAQVVLEHEELAARGADDVEAGDADGGHVPRQAPVQLALVALGMVDRRGGDDPGGDDLPPAVGVEQEVVERPEALGEACGQAVPLGGGEDPGHGVDHERILGEGDAVAFEHRRGRALELVEVELGERGEQRVVARPGLSGLVVGLVEPLAGQVRRHAPRATVRAARAATASIPRASSDGRSAPRAACGRARDGTRLARVRARH